MSDKDFSGEFCVLFLPDWPLISFVAALHIFALHLNLDRAGESPAIVVPVIAAKRPPILP